MTIEHKCIQCPHDTAQVLSEREIDGLLDDEILKKRDLLMYEKCGLK